MRERRDSETVRIPSYLCGPEDQVELDGVASLLQEAAWQHARKLGFAFTEEEATFFWVLHRILVQFYRPPQWNEMVHITTWPSGMERLYALREFHIDSEDGSRLVDVSSSWIILDAVRRRPVRPQNHLPPDRIDSERLLQLPLGKLSGIPVEKSILAGTDASWQQVRPSDTDRNRHVNNARYIQWMQDAAADVMKRSPGVVTFLSETHTGQEYRVIADAHQTIAEVWVRDDGASADSAICACRYKQV
ncbi:MAG TPA: acyl-ACP thioesterase domain-containing protein [Alkalispirochaeta sp.]|nr:acyl-ACP thioesterase domain-containing protein [Alkalispirochaeta sp.]